VTSGSRQVGPPRRIIATPVTKPHSGYSIPYAFQELQHLPQPPALPAASVEILERPEIFRRLRELELGVPELGQPRPERGRIAATALAASGDVDTQRRYSPRRPNLLPQLMRAINDDDISRRQLSAIIARDPALVGSLLKMANSAFYRVSSRQVESIERAVVMLGSDGLRSLVAAALMQPIFKEARARGADRATHGSAAFLTADSAAATPTSAPRRRGADCIAS
jgi:HDOD domain